MKQISALGGGSVTASVEEQKSVPENALPLENQSIIPIDNSYVIATVIRIAEDFKLGLFKRFDDAKYDALAEEINQDPVIAEAFGKMFAEFQPLVGGYVEGSAIRDIVDSTGYSLDELRRSTEFLRAIFAKGTQTEILQHADYAAGAVRYLLDRSMLGDAMDMYGNLASKTVNVEFPKFGYSFKDHELNFLDLLAQISALISIDALSDALVEEGVDPAKIVLSSGSVAEFLDIENDLISGKYVVLYDEDSVYPNVISNGRDNAFLVMPFLGDTFDDFMYGYNEKYGASNICILEHELLHVFQNKKSLRMGNVEHEAEAYVIAMLGEEVFGRKAGAARHSSVADKPVAAEGYSELFTFLAKLFPSKKRDALKTYLFDDRSNYQKSARAWARSALDGAKNGVTVSQEMRYQLRPVALNYFLYPMKGMPTFDNPLNDPQNVASAFALREGLLDISKAATLSRDKALEAKRKVSTGEVYFFPASPNKFYRLSKNRNELAEFGRALDKMAAQVVENMRLIYLNTKDLDKSGSADHDLAYIRTLSYMFIYCGALAGISEKEAFKYFEDKILPFAALKNALRMRSKLQEGN